MSDTCGLFSPFGDHWPSCLLSQTRLAKWKTEGWWGQGPQNSSRYSREDCLRVKEKVISGWYISGSTAGCWGFEGNGGICPWFLLKGTWGVSCLEFPRIGFPSISNLDLHSLAQCISLQQRGQVFVVVVVSLFIFLTSFLRAVLL